MVVYVMVLFGVLVLQFMLVYVMVLFGVLVLQFMLVSVSALFGVLSAVSTSAQGGGHSRTD